MKKINEITKTKEKIKINRTVIDVLIILLVSMIVCLPLLNSNINVYKGEGISNLASAYGSKMTFKNGGSLNIISEFANGFGYSKNLFEPFLANNLLFAFDIVFNNLIFTYKFLCFIILFLTGLFMYKFVKALVNNNNTSLLSAIFYTVSSYHLSELFIRNAFPEFVSFMFVPLVFLGIYNLIYEENKNTYYITIGVAGLILTNTFSAIFTILFGIIWIIFNLDKIVKPNIYKVLFQNIAFILIITCFYWAPMLETSIVARYQINQPEAVVDMNEVQNNGLSFKQLFVSVKDGSSVFELGPHIIMLLCFTVMGFRKINPKFKDIYIYIFISSLITIWMSTKYFPWKILPMSFMKNQNPWQILLIANFFTSIICSINMMILIKKFNIRDVIIVSMIAIIYSIAVFSIDVKPVSNLKNIEDMKIGQFTGKENENVIGCNKGEYLPVNVYKDKFNMALRDKNIQVIKGSALIEDVEQKASNLTAKLNCLDKEYTILELPYIYYPGYEVRLDGMIVEGFQTERGFLGIVVPGMDNAILSVKYTGTTVMNATALISSVGIALFIIKFIKKIKLAKVLKNEEK